MSGNKRNANKTKASAKAVYPQSKSKCAHCQKIVGQKIVLQCENCNNLNLVECLKDIEEGRIQDFLVRKDTFYCTNCVSRIDIETLAIESVSNNADSSQVDESSDRVESLPADESIVSIDESPLAVESIPDAEPIIVAEPILADQSVPAVTSIPVSDSIPVAEPIPVADMIPVIESLNTLGEDSGDELLVESLDTFRVEAEEMKKLLY